MTDKNGTEIRTGDIVQITGAYFKNDNALYFVYRSPGDCGWLGKYLSLHKISKRGKISTAKNNLCSWPIAIYTNDHFRRAEGNAWNSENATIEVIHGIDREEVASLFEEESEKQAELAKHYERLCGTESESVKIYYEVADECQAVADRIRKEVA